jgi:hypothetical protein
MRQMNPKVVRNASSDGARPKRDEIVVFSIVRDSVCAECDSELGKGRFVRIENQRALCLSCADLDHLSYLPRGDAALTRRATKYSTLWAVVVRFSRSRKRYERQGVMVEQPALERAEQECLGDSGLSVDGGARNRRARVPEILRPYRPFGGCEAI